MVGRVGVVDIQTVSSLSQTEYNEPRRTIENQPIYKEVISNPKTSYAAQCPRRTCLHNTAKKLPGLETQLDQCMHNEPDIYTLEVDNSHKK